jgi:hypothetical protein
VCYHIYFAYQGKCDSFRHTTQIILNKTAEQLQILICDFSITEIIYSSFKIFWYSRKCHDSIAYRQEAAIITKSNEVPAKLQNTEGDNDSVF